MAAKPRPLIRLSSSTHQTLKALSKETGKAMSDLAGEAIERYSRERFWERVNRDYAAWTPQQRREYRREFEQWDGLAGDSWPQEDWEEEWRAFEARKAKTRRSVVVRPGSPPRSRAGRSKTGARRER